MRMRWREMHELTNRVGRVFVAMCMMLTGAGMALASGTVGVESVSVEPGGKAVVPIALDNDEGLTLLSVDLTFDSSLCEQMENAIVVKAGRTLADVQEDGIGCPSQGRVRVVIVDLLGKEAIPAGRGTVAELIFDVRENAARGIFPVAVNVNQVSHGPVAVALVSSPGVVSIGTSLVCSGDCNSDGQITINELIGAVGIALENGAVVDCASADRNRDGVVTIDELVAAVNSGLLGCR